jgi:hypothetical protein
MPLALSSTALAALRDKVSTLRCYYDREKRTAEETQAKIDSGELRGRVAAETVWAAKSELIWARAELDNAEAELAAAEALVERAA